MGKNKRTRLASQSSQSSHKKLKQLSKNHNVASKASQGQVSGSKSQGKDGVNPRPHVQLQHEVPTIPFEPTDRILLVGEGDLSFAACLVRERRCKDLTATVLEKCEEELREKYESVDANLAVLRGGEHRAADVEVEGGGEEGDWKVHERGVDDEHGETGVGGRNRKANVLFGVDATKMNWPGKKKSERWDRIIFNFPHVGGKSTDVNRQVRYNQELLVKFFQSSLPLLSPGGSIIVTLFEGEPYTLWNPKDLARHSGLAVEKSFKFQARAYPGYAHARTVGTIKKKGTGEVGGGWKGEERRSRTFVFVRKEDLEMAVQQAKDEKKRKRDDSDGDEDEELGEQSD